MGQVLQCRHKDQEFLEDTECANLEGWEKREEELKGLPQVPFHTALLQFTPTPPSLSTISQQPISDFIPS